MPAIVVNTPYAAGSTTIDTASTIPSGAPGNGFRLSGAGVRQGTYGSQLVHGISATYNDPGLTRHGWKRALVELWGSNFVIEDLHLEGNAGTPPDVCCLMNGGNGAGGYKSDLNRLKITNFVHGFVLGDENDTANCDNLWMRSIQMSSVTTGWRVLTRQSVALYLWGAHLTTVGTLFRFDAGGNFRAEGLDLQHGDRTLLHLVGDGTTSVGINSAIYSIVDVVLDESDFNASLKYYALKQDASNQSADVLFDTFHVKSQARAIPNSVIFQGRGENSVVTIRRGYNVPRKCLDGRDGVTYRIEGGRRIDYDPEELWADTAEAGCKLYIDGSLHDSTGRVYPTPKWGFTR